MAIQISISNAIGSRYRGSVVPPIDPDAQAFITAASITDPTQQAAINQLVVDLKGYSIWSKMKAIYPFCGSTASQHKWNLKDPRDLDAAFRLLFIGGGNWDSNGYTPNGSNGYANTKYNLSTNSTTANVSGGFYSRTNVVNGGATFGALNASNAGLAVTIKNNDQNTYWAANDSVLTGVGNFVTDTRGLFILNKVSLTEKRIYRNGSQISTFTPSSNTAPNVDVYLGARNNNGTAGQYDTRELAFAFLGDTLTNTEAANLYTAVQTFQVTLGRSIGTQTVSDADAQAFVTNAGIVDQVEANAVNNLVIGLKADSLWTKMKAVYPFVGGTATTHKYNLKDPRDLDAAFRLFWNGGVTHSANGVQFGGVNGWAETYLNPNTAFSTNDSFHGSIYSRTNSNIDAADYGGVNASTRTELWIRVADGNLYTSSHLNRIITPNSNSTGYYISTRTNSTTFKVFKNNSQLGSTYTGANGARLDVTMPIGAYKTGASPAYYSNKQYAFASIGDGLTDTDVTNLNTRVTTFNTTLNRNV